MPHIPFSDPSTQFVSLVKRMRVAQDEYIATRDTRSFVQSRFLQRKVDQALVSLQDLN